MGIWHEQNRDKQCLYEFGECVTANYTLNEDNSFKIRNDQYYAKLDMWSIGDDGVGTVADPSKQEGFFKVSINDSPEGDYKVIATDYKSYSVVYGCMSVLDLFSFENLWIITRDPKPE